MKQVLKLLLTTLAKAYVRRYRPQIIAVTGNVGKTSTKEAIAAVLCGQKSFRVSGGNLNNEIGVPLAILGDWSEKYYRRGGTLFFWLKVLVAGFVGLLGRCKKYPEILLMEYGADKPGDIAKLAANFKPHIALVTAVGEVPVHVEYFSGPEGVSEEKSELIKSLENTDFAILNFDDPVVLGMKEKTKAKILTFGFGEGAIVKTSNFDFRAGENDEPLGTVFKLHYGESFVPVKLNGSLGKSQAWSASAAAAVGLILGLNLVQISEALTNYQGPAGRLRILKGIKNSWIIDDTYNAAPASMHLALETLKELPVNPLARRAGKKIAILGDMLELGQYSIAAHRETGSFAGSFVDILFTVGPGGRLIADSAGNQMSKENIFNFKTSLEAGKKVQEIIREGDLILAKGSQGMRMERVVEKIMAEPERKKELLVRQSEKWLNKT